MDLIQKEGEARGLETGSQVRNLRFLTDEELCGSHQLKALLWKPQPRAWSVLLQGHKEYPNLCEGKGKSHIAPHSVIALPTPV